MSEGFYGIDPNGLRTLAFQLDWTQADIARQAGIAYERLTRHSRSATADGTGTQLSHISRWGRLEVEDMRARATAVELAQQINIFGPPLISGPWFPFDGGGVGPTLPYFPFGTPSDYTNAADIPWDAIEDWVRGALGVWNGGHDNNFPVGRWVGGILYMNRVRRFMQGNGPLPTIANGWAMRQLANTRYFSWINNPAVQKFGFRASVGLSIYSTIADGIVVWNHGNPIDAFEEHGAGYVADVARLGFSASTTAFLLAPNPVTGALVIVTGTVWAIAEVVDHWDEISEFFGDVGEGIADATVWVVDETGQLVDAGWDWTADRWDNVTDWGGETWNDFTGWGESQLDNLDRELDDFIDWGGEQWNDFTEWGESQLDNLHREIDEFVDWSGDQVDEIVDWGGDRIEDAKDIVDDVADFAGDAKDRVVDLGSDGLDLVGDGVGALGDGLGAVGGGISKLWGG